MGKDRSTIKTPGKKPRDLTNEEEKILMILFDLYWLRFKKPGDQWYELTDFVRDKLNDDGWKISYTKDDVRFKWGSVKKNILPQRNSNKKGKKRKK